MSEESFQLKKDTESFLKAGVVVLAAVYFFWNLRDFRWNILDNVNLIIHEAGHPIFSILGRFIGMAGGTIMQISVPLAFVLYFLFTKRPFSAAIVMFWLGQSILNVSVYAADAVVTKLPLVGGPIHDWNYMLSHLNLLPRTRLIAGTFRSTGVLIMIAATVIGLFTSFYEKPELPHDDIDHIQTNGL
ncbi:hypothetical protein ACFL6S_08335 [Candidatus Poribacteria bacterium]